MGCWCQAGPCGPVAEVEELPLEWLLDVLFSGKVVRGAKEAPMTGYMMRNAPLARSGPTKIETFMCPGCDVSIEEE